MNKIELFKGDITKLKVDAIVNAANTTLLGGGGVDGAIHRAAGRELLNECRTLNGCKTGDAKITKGYNLPANFVFHTVGPVWHGGKSGEPEKLASCYRRCLEIAKENGVKIIAFPNISTGVYGYPKEEAAKIAMQTVSSFLEKNHQIEQVIFCVFDDENYEIYNDLLNTN
jgi:O-acetyl-ADP-ribose deacetylase (regulator of RNase III)